LPGPPERNDGSASVLSLVRNSAGCYVSAIHIAKVILIAIGVIVGVVISQNR
jgi:hypothetical protein